jgi:hypothetical protein
MADPIVFISTHVIKEGRLNGFTELSREVAPMIEQEKPNTVFFHAYLNEEGSEVTIVHVFPDADSMDLHFQGADDRSARSHEFIQPRRFEIYGTPSDLVLSAMRRETGPGIELILKPRPLFGFIRLTSG